jgi:hypothetical protein
VLLVLIAMLLLWLLLLVLPSHLVRELGVFLDVLDLRVDLLLQSHEIGSLNCSLRVQI